MKDRASLLTELSIYQTELDEIKCIISSEKSKKKRQVLQEQYQDRINYLEYALARTNQLLYQLSRTTSVACTTSVSCK